MFIGLLHTHRLFVYLYIFLFLIKLILLLAGKHEALARFRSNKFLRIFGEMVTPTLFLLSGIGLAAMSGYAKTDWFIVKILLVVSVIVLGILTFKKNSKPLGILTFLILAYIAGISITKSLSLQKPKLSATGEEVIPGSPNVSGENIYHNLNCTTCHGEDGTAKLNGAKDLKASTATDEMIHDALMNGRKGIMPTYKDNLDEAQAKALTEYVKSLRK